MNSTAALWVYALTKDKGVDKNKRMEAVVLSSLVPAASAPITAVLAGRQAVEAAKRGAVQAELGEERVARLAALPAIERMGEWATTNGFTPTEKDAAALKRLNELRARRAKKG